MTRVSRVQSRNTSERATMIGTMHRSEDDFLRGFQQTRPNNLAVSHYCHSSPEQRYLLLQLIEAVCSHGTSNSKMQGAGRPAIPPCS